MDMFCKESGLRRKRQVIQSQPAAFESEEEEEETASVLALLNAAGDISIIVVDEEEEENDLGPHIQETRSLPQATSNFATEFVVAGEKQKEAVANSNKQNDAEGHVSWQWGLPVESGQHEEMCELMESIKDEITLCSLCVIHGKQQVRSDCGNWSNRKKVQIWRKFRGWRNVWRRHCLSWKEGSLRNGKRKLL